jgi:phosphoribosylamine---glycine ligase
MVSPENVSSTLKCQLVSFMRILVVGGGGREHAIAYVLSNSPSRPELFFAPGNPGTAALGQNVAIPANDISNLLTFAVESEIDLTIIGPEQPLVSGVVDRFKAEGLRIMGPTADAARLEGSKAFAKAFMERNNIPTAGYRVFSSEQFEDAVGYLDELGAPVVLKASGLAGGKGAVVCETRKQARETLEAMLLEHRFGDAGDVVVIEEFMEGEESSVFVLTDGAHYLLLPPAQDHKRIGERDTGPNTGGMGAYAPAPVMTGSLIRQVCREVIEPTLRGMQDEGYPYSGILYVGLMMTSSGPKVVEFNCRLGDPEAQAVLPLMDADFVDVFGRIADGDLAGASLRTAYGAAATVVLASEGYPGTFQTGLAIDGIEEAARNEHTLVFHSGTRSVGDGMETAGGRVVAVTGLGDNLEQALSRAYTAADAISFKGKYLRRDIGFRALERR